MKKNIIALAVASAIAAPLAVQAAPTVYGIANVAITTNAGGDSTGMNVTDVASRLGIKGSEDLGNGLKAVYKMEFSSGVDGDSVIGNRNKYVGLAGGFGTVLMGRHDTPTKMSQPKDLFNDGLGDNSKSTSIGWKGGENRLNDVVAYVSPSFGGVKIVAALVSAEDGTSDSSLTNAYSVAAMYGSTKEGIYLAAAMDSATDTYAATEDTFTRISAQYAAGGIVANLMYQMHDSTVAGADVSNNNMTVNVGYKMGAMMPKIKYSMDGGDASGTYTGLGLNYSLGKTTTSYVEYNMFDDDMAGGTGYSSISIGLQQKF